MSEEIDLNALIEQALAHLQEDLQTFPAFDPERPYEEKNAYINRANQPGILLLQRGYSSDAEDYYKVLLHRILEFEEQNNKVFNKGIVYGNLGVSELANDKYDAGIAHLLAADAEDRPIVLPDHHILDPPLWQQFERPIILDYLIGIGTDNSLDLSFVVDENFLETMLRQFDSEDRIFFLGTILAIRYLLELNAQHPNIHSRGRLYSSLKDLCLVTESMLRKGDMKRRPDINPPGQGTLHNYLSRADLGFPQQSLEDYQNARHLPAFLRNLEEIMAKANDADMKRLHILYLVRNFTGHHFDVSPILSPSGVQFFDDLFTVALRNVISAIFFLHYHNTFKH